MCTSQRGQLTGCSKAPQYHSVRHSNWDLSFSCVFFPLLLIPLFPEASALLEGSFQGDAARRLGAGPCPTGSGAGSKHPPMLQDALLAQRGTACSRCSACSRTGAASHYLAWKGIKSRAACRPWMLCKGHPKQLGTQTSLIFDDFKIKHWEKERQAPLASQELCSSISCLGHLSQLRTSFKPKVRPIRASPCSVQAEGKARASFQQ